MASDFETHADTPAERAPLLVNESADQLFRIDQLALE
jgi:hypothetical protein